MGSQLSGDGYESESASVIPFAPAAKSADFNGVDQLDAAG
jgi:hypothetical protein